MTGGEPTVGEALAALERAGGLVTPNELAKEWAVTRQAVARRIERGEFPPPLKTVAGTEVYLRAQVEPLRYPERLRGISAQHARIAGDRVDRP